MSLVGCRGRVPPTRLFLAGFMPPVCPTPVLRAGIRGAALLTRVLLAGFPASVLPTRLFLPTPVFLPGRRVPVSPTPLLPAETEAHPLHPAGGSLPTPGTSPTPRPAVRHRLRAGGGVARA
ncbi:hypothetical protein, partial [Streptomyces acidiscabies]|uniref:hypothetical protein n=1 Tax=Streptomyces acidiscabies TaxID=42234 RepID=UPI001C4C2B4E